MIVKRLFQKLRLVMSVLVGLIMGTNTTLANEFIPTDINHNSSIIEEPTNPGMNIVTPVSQLADVSAEDWAFQALRSLIDRYGCLTGYPNNTYRGNQPLTRYEFAAGLKACLDYIAQQNINGTTHPISTTDRETLQRLQQDFSAELNQLTERLYSLETRTTQLESRQFSPTLELEGEVIFAVSGVQGTKKADGSGETLDNNLTFGNRVRLTLETSFTGKDRLQIRLQGRDIPEFAEATGTQMANLGFDGNDDNEVELDELEYRFLVTPQTQVSLGTVGIGLGDLIPTVNPLFSGSGDGSISTFGRENPIRRQGEGAGIGISQNLGESVNLSLGYVAIDANEADNGILGNDTYAAIAQLTWQPSDIASLSFTYAHSSNSFNTGTGSELTSDPFNRDAEDVTANSFAAEASIRVNPRFILGGRVGLIQAQANDLPNQPNANIFTWAMLLAFPDFGKEDSLAGIVIGQPPKILDNELGVEFEDQDTALHLETFYRFPLNDDISITPGIFVITNPEHNDDNDAIYVGTIRVTLTF
jgi:hypothetical protein